MSNKRKVLMICSRYKPAIGGVEVHVERIVQELATKGFDISILTSSHIEGLKPQEHVGPAKICRIPFGWEKNPFLVYFWLLRNIGNIRRFDIVHIHDTIPLLFWYLPQLLLNPNKAIFTTFHGYERDPVPLLFKILRKIARKLSKRVICIGNYIENIYQICCERILIGAVESISQKKVQRTGLIFVGRVEPDTGVLQYLDVLKILELKYEIRTHLTVCGGGSLESDLVYRAEKNRIKILMRGVVDDPAHYINSAKICLAGGYLSILEAMSLGIPVIALAQSELKFRYYLSMKDSGGPISIHKTPEGVAGEINRLLANPSLYQEISYKGKEFASILTWERMASEYLKLWFNRWECKS